ncbi:uncharacterized protein LOC134537815 isoform X3 [Bacillus rossius redtenbacheri]|uniref:uncharacterized protein LOC134537815 isoform X3 n=1 Tax=Bacillus rossius redtenbacheri TaxID=93214 RepID=UPI002FDE03C2
MHEVLVSVVCAAGLRSRPEDAQGDGECPVMLGYVLGQKMPEVLVSVMSAAGLRAGPEDVQGAGECPVMLGYVLCQKMSEVLDRVADVAGRGLLLQIRMFNLLAALLFVVSGAVVINYWVQYRDYWRAQVEEGRLQHWQDRMLLATGVASLANSALYLLDFGHSIRRTLKLIGQ